MGGGGGGRSHSPFMVSVGLVPIPGFVALGGVMPGILSCVINVSGQVGPLQRHLMITWDRTPDFNAIKPGNEARFQ